MASQRHYEPGRTGIHFKDGKLYQFTKRHVLVMRPWPRPSAWYKRASHGWRATREVADALMSRFDFCDSDQMPAEPPRPFALPDGQLTLPGISSEEWWARQEYVAAVAFFEFVSLIPKEVRHEVFRYRTRRWHLLSVMARCPGAVDLSQSNPALLFALANNWIFHKPAVTKPIRSARGLINRKQRVIQEWLGFPGTEAVRRLLAKIDTEGLSVRGLIYLRTALGIPGCVKRLSHMPVIGEAALMLATHARLRAHVSPRLLLEVNEREKTMRGTSLYPNPATELLILFHDTLRMCEAVEWIHCPRVFQSLEEMQTLHDELMQREDMIEQIKHQLLTQPLPKPPFAGTEHIVPLTTVEELRQESMMQHNCAVVRALEVAKGRQYLYSVNMPVRGTLAVSRTDSGWELSEFRLMFNRPVDWQTMREVFETLRRT